MFSPASLDIDAASVADTIADAIRDQVRSALRRRGVVIGLSGGIDSSVVAALCVRALGPKRVFGLFMPERDSSADSLRLGNLCATSLGIEAETENIGPALAGLGCYRRQEEAVRTVFPDYGRRRTQDNDTGDENGPHGWKFKLTLPSLLQNNRLNVFTLVVQTPTGEVLSSRMPPKAYLQLVAATNFKQRVRKMMEYYHADRLVFAVAGTPNRLEYDQGFFVKQGDGAADFKPIAHLFKSQVYQLAEYLGVPEEIRTTPPTTDTYSMAQTQEEFFFALPYDKMDMCLYGHDHEIPAAEIAAGSGMDPAQVEWVYRDIDSKRRATHYLHLPPLFIDKVVETDLCIPHSAN